MRKLGKLKGKEIRSKYNFEKIYFCYIIKTIQTEAFVKIPWGFIVHFFLENVYIIYPFRNKQKKCLIDNVEDVC